MPHQIIPLTFNFLPNLSSFMCCGGRKADAWLTANFDKSHLNDSRALAGYPRLDILPLLLPALIFGMR